jgi:YcxB-like protein
MKIDYELTEEDFVAATRLGYSAIFRAYKIRNGALRLLGPFFIVLGVALGLITQNWASQVPIFIVGCFWAALAVFVTYRVRVQYRKANILHGRRSLDVLSDQLHFITPLSEVNAKWSLYSKFAEDARSFVLVQAGVNAFVPIPKRELSPSQIIELRTLFETHLPHK